MFEPYQILDDRFRDLVLPNVRLRKISGGHLWTEGPVWFPAHQCLLFSDIPNQKIFRWMCDGSVNEFRDQSDFANGNTRDINGCLVTCQHGSRTVTRTEHNGKITTLADGFEGRRLNSPNDVVVKTDGSIWFTDPTYGILSNYEGYKATPEQEFNNVFRLEPETGIVESVAQDFRQPNGLAFSNDEKLLYVTESGSSHDATIPAVIRVYDVVGESALGNGRDFAEIDNGLPDGIRVDCYGNVWSSAADGVHCFDPGGKLLGKVLVPETVSNLTFGGARGNELMITATSSVYAIHVNSQALVR
ncbi:SMP-30/gluconolactonase/LRE family protein [Thalassospira sp. MCCC 1A01148]|uniref:Gluconolactonase n=2 Tax=Thalassospira profundimaris TaxID=502049 RepID=A0A367V8B0_9PROT|nr:SMP-30/gluconolactonase/LRE family protein [Thalassospira sp. MCCC 1A01148]KZB72900.1 gluconolactonase [Thalassospira sp. MCCC 1A01148]MBR9900117.1 SMP-30/gluconolactonase/LRE family protein [Rhodospirillales bacterium]RCK20592.1 gluconolactonase [Thalassospira profundimaris]